MKLGTYTHEYIRRKLHLGSNKGQGHRGQMHKLHQLQQNLYILIIVGIGGTRLKMGVLLQTRGQGQRGQMHKYYCTQMKLVTYTHEYNRRKNC